MNVFASPFASFKIRAHLRHIFLLFLHWHLLTTCFKSCCYLFGWCLLKVISWDHWINCSLRNNLHVFLPFLRSLPPTRFDIEFRWICEICRNFVKSGKIDFIDFFRNPRFKVISMEFQYIIVNNKFNKIQIFDKHKNYWKNHHLHENINKMLQMYFSVVLLKENKISFPSTWKNISTNNNNKEHKL